MDLDTFLRLHDSDIAQLIDGARSVVPIGNRDRLIAVGSLVEGLGNRKSDVDLFHVTADPRSAAESPDEVRTFAAGRCVVDLRLVPAGYVATLRSRLRHWAEGAWNLTVAARFSPDERLLLHRLTAGRTLWPAESAADATLVQDLARLKLHVARHMARTIQVDMAGYHEIGDPTSLVHAGQDLLGHAVDGLLAAFGLTNPTAKWRNRLLDRLPPDWETLLACRPSGLTASRLHWRLHRAPAEPTADAAFDHACRIVTFARVAFVFAEETLIRGGTGHRLAYPGFLVPAERPALPFLDLDVDFCRLDEGFALGRLNAFGEPVHMGFDEFAVMQLFDGLTTARQAAMAVGHRAGRTIEEFERFAHEMCRSSFVAGTPAP